MKRFSNIFILATVALGISGCETVPIVPFDIGGSRSDGVVKMAAPLGDFDRVEAVDWEAGEQEALRRCRLWGYSKVEAFSGIAVECTEPYCYSGTCGCSQEQATRNYQCIE